MLKNTGGIRTHIIFIIFVSILENMNENNIVGEPGLEPGISNTKNLRVYLNLKYDIVSNE